MEEYSHKKQRAKEWYEFIIGITPLIIFYIIMSQSELSDLTTITITLSFLFCWALFFGWMLINTDKNIQIIKSIIKLS